MSEPAKVKCPSCGGMTRTDKFCMLCGAPLPAAPTPTVPGMPEVQQKSERKSIAFKAAVTPEAVQGAVEKIKVSLFAEPAKKPGIPGIGGIGGLFGPKPEQLIVVQKIEKAYETYVRIHAQYSVEYYKKNFYEARVEPNVVEVVSGNMSYTPSDGLVKIEADERKVYQNEGTAVFDKSANEVKPEVIPAGSPEESPQAVLSAAGVDLGKIKRLEDTVLSLALNVFKFRICQAPDEISRIRTETLAITEFSTFFAPVYRAMVAHQKTGETRVVVIDGITGQMVTGG